jgi:hypothetical protein
MKRNSQSRSHDPKNSLKLNRRESGIPDDNGVGDIDWYRRLGSRPQPFGLDSSLVARRCFVKGYSHTRQQSVAKLL